MTSLKPPVALITGAGSGIGRATAVELGRRGYRVVLVGRRRTLLEETAGLVGPLTPFVFPADVSDPLACAAAVEATVREIGSLHALINSAGLAPVLSIEQTTAEQWKAVLDTNLSATYYLSRCAWPHFQRQNGGVIVNLSSLAARDPFPHLSAYAAAKAGLNGLSLALGREGAAWNIRVHTLGLGAVETTMLRGVVSAEALPTERTLSPEAVATIIGQCVAGELLATNGEVIWVHQGPA